MQEVRVEVNQIRDPTSEVDVSSSFISFALTVSTESRALNSLLRPSSPVFLLPEHGSTCRLLA